MTKQDRIAILKDILAIDSTNQNEEAVANCLAGHLKKADIPSKQVVFAPGRNNLIAEIGSGSSVFALSGHMDVVPAGNPDEWSNPPFSPVEKDGNIYARGATDMKSGVAAMVAAMIELKEENARLPGKVRLLATVGEETGLLGAHQLTEEGYADDVEALIISEPSGHRIVYAHKGIITYTVTSKGKNAHSSMPELGINAIDNLLMFYNKMMEEFAKLNEENVALGKMVFCNSIIEGGRQFNIVPDHAKFTSNIRTIPEVGNDMLIKLLNGIVDDLNKNVKDMSLELEIEQSHVPMFSDINSKLVQTASAEAKKMFNEELPLLGAPGGTDAAEFIRANKDMQIIIFGPGNETMHQVDEFVEIDNYLEMIDLYKKIIIEYWS